MWNDNICSITKSPKDEEGDHADRPSGLAAITCGQTWHGNIAASPLGGRREQEGKGRRRRSDERSECECVVVVEVGVRDG